MTLPVSVKAGLRREEVIAVVLYTGPMVGVRRAGALRAVHMRSGPAFALSLLIRASQLALLVVRRWWTLATRACSRPRIERDHTAALLLAEVLH